MQQVAQGLASLGRGDDKMLVHMTPREVQGLQSLAMAHGGSLTINPHTGLPEAGILDSLLPTVLGIGLSAATGLPAWGIGLGIGGATALASGDLRKGLMAGLGAFGGAGLGGSLFGSEALGAEAAKQQAIQQAASQNVDSILANMGADNPAPLLSYEKAALDAASQFAAKPWYEQAGSSLKYGFENPSAFGANVTQQLGGKYGAMAAAAPTVMAGLGALNKPATLQGATPADKGTIRPYGYRPGDVNPNFGKPGEPYFLNQGFTAYPTYKAAAGGQVPQPSLPLDLSQNYPGSNITKSSYATLPSTDSQEVVDGYGPKINPFTGAEGMAEGGLAATEIYTNDDPIMQATNKVKGLSESQLSMLSEEADDAMTQAAAIKELELRRVRQRVPKSAYTKMAAGGIASLPEYAAGGKLLRGPGDGMSDDIPAVIKGARPQRAALADGEFVIPADVVSHLGNGSTDAGAKRLYSMMNKVRKARTGNPKQGKQINAERYMPA